MKEFKPIEQIIKQDDEIRRYMKKIVDQNRMRMVILRGFVIGIFTSLGTLVGLAVIVFVGVNLLGGLKQIPLIDIILEQTKLDVLIESQVNKITKPDDSSNPNTPNEPEVKLLEYKDSGTKIQFKYPDYLSSVNTSQGSDPNTRTVQFTGNGELTALDVHINRPPVIVGNSSQRFLALPNGDRAILNVYESGVVINGQQWTSSIFHTHIDTSSGGFDFVGLADADSPKTAREVFSAIIESIRIN